MSTEGDWPMPVPPPESWEEERTFKPKRRSRRRTSEHTCEAALARGPRCHLAARHQHRTVEGDLLNLCGTHYRMLLKHEKRESAPDVLARWREWKTR